MGKSRIAKLLFAMYFVLFTLTGCFGIAPATVRAGANDLIIQAESCTSYDGINIKATRIGSCDPGNWASYSNVDLGAGYKSFCASIGNNDKGTTIEVRLDSLTGPIVGVITARDTEGWNNLQEHWTELSGASGIHDLYMVFGGNGGAMDVDWIKFSNDDVPPPPPVTRVRLQAEKYDAMSGVRDGGWYIGSMEKGDWLCYKGVNLTNDEGNSYNKFTANLGLVGSGILEVRLDSITGPLVAKLDYKDTGSWNVKQDQSTAMTGASGIHDVYIVSGGGTTPDIDYFRFEYVTVPSAPAGLTVIPKDSRVSIQWNPNTESDIIGYNIYKNGVKLNTLYTGTSYILTGLTNGDEYSYSVSAVSAITGESEKSSEVKVIPGVVSDSIKPSWTVGSEILTPVIDHSMVRLSWHPAQDNVDVSSYRIYKDGQLISTVHADYVNYPNAYSFDAPSLPLGSSAIYKIEAGDEAANWSSDGPQKLVSYTAAALPDVNLPADSILDITKPPYNAKGDGITDNTAVIQQAINDWVNKSRIIYFPKGVYLISNKLTYGTDLLTAKNLTLQGQNRDNTILKLKDHSPGYENSSTPKPLLTLFEGGSTGQAFHNEIFNMTFDVGSGNPGAIGVQWMNCNQGSMYDVVIKSSDPEGKGAVGLDFTRHWPGPGYFKNILIEGFDHGINTTNNMEYSLVFEHITVKNQRIAGWYNTDQIVTVRDFKSFNKVPAIMASRSVGMISLIDSTLSGGALEKSAIVNNGNRIFVRNTTMDGYGLFIDNQEAGLEDVTGTEIKEYVSHGVKSVFQSPGRSLGLPIEETPEVPLGDPNDWVAVDGSQDDDTAAIQAAIDKANREGKSTVYFPYLPQGGYKLSDTINIYGSVRRITGME